MEKMATKLKMQVFLISYPDHLQNSAGSLVDFVNQLHSDAEVKSQGKDQV